MFSAPASAFAQFFDLQPTVHLSEVPRFTVPFTVELRIHNAGPDQAVGVIVNHTVPPGLTLLGAEVYGCVVQDGSSYCYDPANPVSTTITGNAIQFQAGRIPAGWYRPIFVRVVAATAGTYLTQTATAPMPWELPGNNSIAFPVEVHSHGLLVKGGEYIPEQAHSNAVFSVRLVPASASPVTVEYRAGGSTATAGEDFAEVTGTLTFPPGVTNRTVAVPVFDDTLHEPYTEAFTLFLTNAVNAEVDPNPQYSLVADDEPALPLSIQDASPVTEGDGETTTTTFELSLNGFADVPISVDYTAGPPVSQSGTLVIPARTNRALLSVSFNGNLTPETNRVFDLTLTNPRGMGAILLNPGTAHGMILDDDAIPGKFHHLVMDPVLSPQLAGRPVPVTLRALDYEGNPATNFSGTISLGAYDFGRGQPHQFVDVSNFVGGVVTAGVVYTNVTTNATFTAWLWMGSYYVTASSSRFLVVRQPQLFLSLPGLATEGDGAIGTGTLSITNLDVLDVEVQLTSGDPLEISLPLSVRIPSGQTSAVFNVTIVDDDRLDGTHPTGVQASSPGYLPVSGSISVADNESTTLHVSIPDGLYEAPGTQVINGTVSVDRPVAVLVQVALSSSDNTELSVPPTAFISPGETNGTFWVLIRDDALMDGPQPATVTARVPNWTEGSATAIVGDNDTNLTVVLNLENKTTVAEGMGTLTNGLRVQLPGTNTADVTVQLSISDPTEAAAPASVIIRAGQLFVLTNLTVIDDSRLDGNQVITITASSPGLNPGTRTLTIFDNDPHHFVFNAIPTPQTSGVPFQVRFTARDVNNNIMSYASGPVYLAAFAEGTPLLLSPAFTTNYLGARAGNFWGENVTITGWGTNVQIRASTTDGASSLSNPFNVVPPLSLTDMRIRRVERQSERLYFYFETLPGLSYRLHYATSLPAQDWIPVEPGETGTGAEMSLSDAMADPKRFYRLSVSPVSP